ncbi:hypothetical protein [Alkalihalobacillus sp. CinArs1]|uniref:hypothetical protein n=1 Tax=Alkalihalobacillus sp. CinArs1 TaxID=2995314 RepID=UPI0022DDC16A|nr:hypothetical protein [Alkalihalobacillus sp. CinArs1]
MKKIAIATLVLSIFLIGPTIVFSSFTPSDELSDFPVPKRAVLIEEGEDRERYEWSKASEENGIPLGYKFVLKAKGWKEEERLGASVIYRKDRNKINMISTSGYVDLIKLN